MKNNLIIIGAGSFAFEVLNYISEIFKPIEIKKIFFFGEVKNINEFKKIYDNCFFIHKIPNYLNRNNTNFIVAHGNENLRSKMTRRNSIWECLGMFVGLQKDRADNTNLFRRSFTGFGLTNQTLDSRFLHFRDLCWSQITFKMGL